MKLNIADPKTGRCKQLELSDEEASLLFNKKIGDKITLDIQNLSGYEFLITGGSDYCGFPMRKDVDGTARKRILAVSGVGIRKKGKGVKQRKTLAGNTIYEKTSQVNLKIIKYGKEKLFEETQQKETQQEKQQEKNKEQESTNEQQKQENQKQPEKESKQQSPEESKKPQQESEQKPKQETKEQPKEPKQTEKNKEQEK